MGSIPKRDTVLIIGAGVGGLAAAIRLAGAGIPVHVIEAADRAGGKLRAVDSSVGPVDAGPTVMTLRPVFEALFADAGLELADYVQTHSEPLLARHFWTDGSRLDLFADPEASAAEVRNFGGPGAENEFRRFQRQTQRLFEAFDGPVMKSASPNIAGILEACPTVAGLTAMSFSLTSEDSPRMSS